jgi:NADPH2:quinone reductase
MPHAVVIRKWLTSPSELNECIETFELPETIADDEVEVAVKAVAVNFAENLMVQGLYQIKPPLPYNPGSDWAGEIIRVGKNVRNVAPGDRVFGGTIRGSEIALGYGVGRAGYAERLICPFHFVRKFPSNISFDQASMLCTTYATAHYALIYEAKIQPGDVVLVHASAGALGLAACQVAKSVGATVIATASTKEKLEVARIRGGADFCINYKEGDWVGAIKKATADREGLKRGLVDVCFDPVGLAMETSKVMGYHSRLLVLGFTGWNSQDGLDGQQGLPQFAVNRLLVKHCSLIGIYLYNFADNEPELCAQMWEELFAKIESGAYDPVVFDSFDGLNNVAKAFELVQQRETYGKVTIRPAGTTIGTTIAPAPEGQKRTSSKHNAKHARL